MLFSCFCFHTRIITRKVLEQNQFLFHFRKSLVYLVLSAFGHKKGNLPAKSHTMFQLSGGSTDPLTFLQTNCQDMNPSAKIKVRNAFSAEEV